jgi:ERCC4-type nuclease
LKLITDTREKLPYSFRTPTEQRALPIGDYSISGLENRISIERKSLDDLVACLTQERERFERELFKGRALDYFALVIEGSLSDLVEKRYRSEALPKSVIQSLLAFSVRYRLPVFFCETRAFAEKVTESLLLKYAREVDKQAKCLSGEK